MNEQERAELERLKRRLESLRHEFDLLWTQTRQLESRLNLSRGSAPPPVPAVEPIEPTPRPQPPPAASAGPSPTSPVEPSAPAAAPLQAHPPPLPPVIPAAAPALASSGAGAQAASVSSSREGVTGAAPPGPPPLQSEPASASESSFEMKFGTVWSVRIGVVLVLTALVFFGNYAYENFISKLGAAGKLALMYLGSGLLLGIGAWLQRRQESLKNYAQVLVAGGLAAVYFTTYAAHHIENLRVIPSATLDGLLLLGWAGFMAWLADRRKSELLALFAVGLAYYTAIITNIGMFTLYSNLVLTAAGVLFFVRNRWAALSFASLLATYGGYSYWRFYVEGQWLWHLNLSSADYQLGNLFLLGYWLLYTSAVFLSRHERFSGDPRAAYLTLNNAAFFGLVVLARLYVHTGSFWKLSLGFGSALLGLAALAARRLANERIVVNSYLTQGLVLVTLGFMTWFTGLKLALVLAAESVILLVFAYQRQNLLLHVATCITAVLAVGWAAATMRPFDRVGCWLGSFVGVLMAFNAFWSRRRDAAESEEGLVRAGATFFSALALLTWLVTTWNNTTRAHLPLVLAVETVVFTASVYLLRVPEISLLGQLYLVLAQVLWLWESIDRHPSRPWWNPALLIAITLGLSHWWQRQTRIKSESGGARFLQTLYALAIIGLLFFWLQPLFDAPVWLAFTSLLATALTFYGVATRAWPLAACGQLFLVASGWEFFSQIFLPEKPGWYLPLAPIAALGLLSLGTVQWFESKPDAKTDYGEAILPVALVYRWAALGMLLAWVYQYVPARERVWVLSLLGALVFGWSGWRKKREGLRFSAVLTAAGLWLFWFPAQDEPTVYLPNLLAILLLLGQQRFARRMPEHFEFEEAPHAVMILLGGASLWRFVSKWVVLLQSEGFYLTVAWAAVALALFVTGLLLRERVYRWLGLGVLGCALGRVVIFDVWKLESLYRILSFMALGIVLLVLGFIYNRYQAKIREWL